MKITYDQVNTAIDILRAYVKDSTVEQLENKMMEAQRELILAEAQARRQKNKMIIMQIHKLDMHMIGVKASYEVVKIQLNDECQEAVEGWMRGYDVERKKLVKSKY